ncbi:GNAT family N-acetyltransferase [Paenibacillus rigui]|uniref:RimJ/RimL family protein N-acetyltransferase n=1 Tax=Paenibacillus rigui TaxID=554312 RepID=A0A229UJW7_9BACL|nr:GNAT family protein [Paenibacillus rigui]OXM83189.1 RimJ/RimL family protein N-acetyltransferase [Paenibacillus rigui]
MKLILDRVHIRPFTLADAEPLRELRVHNRDYFRPYEPARPDSHFTLDYQKDLIRTSWRDAQKDAGYIFGIFLNENAKLIGRVSLTAVFRGPWQNANIGYYMDQRYTGCGYMTEAVRLAIQYAFTEIGLHRLQGAVMPRNTRSIRVLEKAGFRYEGLARSYLHIHEVWEDHGIYAMTSEEWDTEARQRVGMIP